MKRVTLKNNLYRLTAEVWEAIENLLPTCKEGTYMEYGGIWQGTIVF